MKLIHCADIHLDSALTSNLDKDKARERNSEIMNTFLRMIRYAAGNDIKAILISGDMFDKKKVSKKTAELVFDAIKNAPAVEFYYLKGNHDALNFAENASACPANLHLFNRTWTGYDLSSVTITGAEFDDANAPILADGLSLDKDRVNIVMLHGTASESGLRSDGDTIAIKSYRNKGIDYMALGHIHAVSEGRIDDRGVYAYPGCLEGRGFDELGDHGFILLDIDESTKTVSRSFIPFAGRKLHNPRPDISGARTVLDAEKIVEDELKKLAINSRDLVKISLTGTVDADADIQTELITKYFENDYYFVKTKDETKTRIDYLAYANDASLKGEFVRTVQEDTSLSDEEAAEIVRCGMRVLAGEEVFD